MRDDIEVFSDESRSRLGIDVTYVRIRDDMALINHEVYLHHEKPASIPRDNSVWHYKNQKGREREHLQTQGSSRDSDQAARKKIL